MKIFINTFYYDGEQDRMYIVFPIDPNKGWRINEVWNISYLRSNYPSNRFI